MPSNGYTVSLKPTATSDLNSCIMYVKIRFHNLKYLFFFISLGYLQVEQAKWVKAFSDILVDSP